MIKMSKIRFLATGDIHSDKKLINCIKNSVELEKIDFVVLIGDISEKKDDFKDILEIFKEKQIFMVPGNHESKRKLSILQENYNVHLVGNQPVLVHDDLAFFGSNYVNQGPYEIHEQLILNNLIENFNSVKDVKCKIMLHHVPPFGTKIGDASPYFPFIGGSFAVREFLENFSPDMTLVGHIHETSGLEERVNKTRVINVGRTFKVFEFDKEKGEVSELLNKF